MTEKSRKQLAVLGMLVAVLAIVIFYVSRDDDPAGRSARPSNQAGRGASQQPPLTVADVNLEVLKAEHGDLQEPERNPFVFRPKPPPPPPPETKLSPQPPVDTRPPGPPPPPPLPPIPLKFIGVLEIPSQNAKVAVLSDGRGGTFHAREGQTVLGQYKLLKIGAESAEMSYVDGRGRQTLRLSGQ